MKNTLIERNTILHAVDNVKNKTNILFSKLVPSDTMHYALRCDP